MSGKVQPANVCAHTGRVVNAHSEQTNNGHSLKTNQMAQNSQQLL